MLELARGLDPARLDAVAALEQEVVAADGGRLKLEWNTLRGRPGDRVEDLLWWDGGRLVGFLGLYAFGAPVVEVTGMVAPDHRRRGIATALLDAGLAQCAERGAGTVLLVVPRTPPAGRLLAQARGGVLDHSEHALRLTGAPAGLPPDRAVPGLRLRWMEPADGAVVTDLLTRAFGHHGPDVDEDDVSERAVRLRAGTLVVEVDGEPVGTMRLDRTDEVAGVYGFAVHPDRQGQGIGRAALHAACLLARADGASVVHLEVAVDNERALGLYTSLGFVPVTTEDYLSLPLPGAASDALGTP